MRIRTIVLLLLFNFSSYAFSAERCIPMFPSSPKRQIPLIVIDAGHGGKDPGTHSTTPPKYEEKSLALRTALILNSMLRDMGYRTKLTRNHDVFIELNKRAEIANKAKAELFVSVHYNSASKKATHGIEIYYFQSDKEKTRTAASKKVAEKTLNELMKITKAKSRGVKNGNFAVIREISMPGILVECGFLTCPEEREKLYDPAYQRKIARGIAKGIDASIRKDNH